MDLREQLNRLEDELNANPSRANRDARRRFWRLVGRVKRLDRPDLVLVAEVSAVRDLLYHHSLGRSISLRWLALWLLAGAGVVAYYIHLVLAPGNVTGLFSDDIVIGLHGAAAVFFLYPFGRLLAGRALGIEFDGITRDIYLLPTLKINYESYLLAAPPRRMWFFFFSGAWTSFVLVTLGLVGYVLAGEWTALALGIGLALLEAAGAIFGTRWGGELGHFRRERLIVRDWRKARASS